MTAALEAELTADIESVCERQYVGLRRRPELDLQRATRVANHLFNQGWRMPDCKDAWQHDRLTGAVWQSGKDADDTAYAEWCARNLIRVVGVTKEEV